MKKSIELISKEMDSLTDIPDSYVIEKLWEIIKVRNPWPWGKDAEPGRSYRIKLLSKTAATMAVEIERLFKENKTAEV